MQNFQTDINLVKTALNIKRVSEAKPQARSSSAADGRPVLVNKNMTGILEDDGENASSYKTELSDDSPTSKG